MGEFASSIFNILLGWVKGAVSAMWNILSSSDSHSLLYWITQNWKTLVIILCLVCTLADFLIYLVRWRPIQVWRSFFRRIKGNGIDVDELYYYGHKKSDDFPEATFSSYYSEEPYHPSESGPFFNPAPVQQPVQVEAVAFEPQVDLNTEEAHPSKHGISRKERLANLKSKMPKSFSLQDDDEFAQIKFQPAQPTVDKDKAYHAPVYPSQWKAGDRQTDTTTR